MAETRSRPHQSLPVDPLPIEVTLKRKNGEQCPSPGPSPKRTERATSVISIGSDNEESERIKRAASFISIGSDDEEPEQNEHVASLISNSLGNGDEGNFNTVPLQEPVLCEEQQRLVDAIKQGRNVFFTGSAGTGKSTVLKAAVRALQEMGRRVYVTAPTGRAAVQVEGTTTYSFLGWSPHSLSKGEKLIFIANKNTKRRIRRTDVLVIDEISMVSSNFLSHMDAFLKYQRFNREVPFGGLQMIITGDFCQLPPVKPFDLCYNCGQPTRFDGMTDQHVCPCGKKFRSEDKWAFTSPAWDGANFMHVELREIHRQKEQAFVKVLQRCRLGIPFTEKDLDLLLNHEYDVKDAAQLLSTRAEVDEINREKYNAIRKPERKYRALDGFEWNGVDGYDNMKHGMDENGELRSALLKDHPFDTVVSLKEGMVVMLQVNLDIRAKLVNGSQGVVVGWKEISPPDLPAQLGHEKEFREDRILDFCMNHMELNKDDDMHVFPVVRFMNGMKRTIFPWCYVNPVGELDHDRKASKLYRTQIPLVPGWAITIHKSQGMTLDRVIVNVARAFAEGQVYVALSRARSLYGLKIEGAEGLSVGVGGNETVNKFLQFRFGRELHQGLLED
ncbi:hypothetical protein FGRMN_10039 [Fusarium graminum]|nr:hypothetical protein FGRMN_10039 [Fusarium graminum]